MSFLKIWDRITLIMYYSLSNSVDEMPSGPKSPTLLCQNQKTERVFVHCVVDVGSTITLGAIRNAGHHTHIFGQKNVQHHCTDEP